MRKPLAAMMALVVTLTGITPIARSGAHYPEPLQAVPEAESEIPSGDLFRTRVTFPNTTARARLEELGVIVLEEEVDGALVLADPDQLEALARLRFEPRQSDDLGRLVQAHGQTDPNLAQALQPLLDRAAGMSGLADVSDPIQAAARDTLRAAMQTMSPEQRAEVAALSSVDDDADGLTNTQEDWWCTDPLDPDSDGDGASDADEVDALKAWMGNETGSYPATGKPFVGWPPDHPGCYDDDMDSIPDLAERWELGLNMNRESTDRDKFDDGQELFGNTHCPGSDSNCGYGALPRDGDWGIIFAEMPSWVEPPGDHPLTAAFPVPEIDVLESSLQMEAVTTVTTDHVIGEGEEQTYSTETTEGTSTSVANTETWNKWQETSESVQTREVTRLATQPTSLQSASSDDVSASTGVGSWLKRKFDYQRAELKAAWGCLDGKLNIEIIELGAADAWTDLRCRSAIREARKISPEWSADYPPDEQNAQQNTIQRPISIEIQNTMSQRCESDPNCSHDTDNMVGGYGGTQYVVNESDELISQRLHEIAGVLSVPVRTETNTEGRSWGGSRTTTHSEYEEHAVTNAEAFSSEESWGTATAVDSSHAADLWFTYQVRNIGHEYAREICDLAFNVYIGDDPNPAYTYFVGDDLGGDGCFHNFMPGEEHPYTAHRIPLTLEQMKAIDLGGPVRVVVEDYTYGIDELFYEDAVNSNVQLAIEDGTDDGDEVIDHYLIPTWGEETVLDVLGRYFPHTTDADGNLTAVWTPEQRTDTPSWCHEPRHVGDTLWCKHALSTADWWNIYTDGLGDGTEGFQDTPAEAGSTALFRFNRDTDLDGYSDRSEERLGTDPQDAGSHPEPELIAGVHSIREGDYVTSTLSLLNTGFYDAYGVEAVMIAPNDSISVTNNTVGGSGRVRALKSVVVGSRILHPSYDTSTWQGTAQPFSTGYYTGEQDRTYTFTAVDSGVVSSDTLHLAWGDGLGASGTLDFGSGYASPMPLDVGSEGVQVGMVSGEIQAGDTFTVAARTPRDTFQYAINREPYTEPIVIVSYNDPQGNHRLVTPVHLSHPTEDLAPHSGKMLHESAGVEIVTHEPFTPTETIETDIIAQVPVPTTLTDAHVFLEFIDPEGTVVREEATTVTLGPGPNVVTIPWDSDDFNPAYDPNQDYIVMAFFTDWQGNILDTAARPLSSFQADPRASLAFDESDTVWDFGSVPQGTKLEHTFTLANTGQMALKAAAIGTGARVDQAVPGNPIWIDTGLDVAAGDAIGIRADGTVCYNGGSSCYGPDGRADIAPSGWALPGERELSLIAKIGDGSPFFVGSVYVETAGAGGRLYLGTNDCDGCHDDNSGSYQAHIEIQGVPTSLQESASFSLAPGQIEGMDTSLDTYYLPTGAFDRSILIRTSDTDRPTQTFRIQGTVEPYTAPAQAMSVDPYRPWDQHAAIAGDGVHREIVMFDDAIDSEPSDVEPLWIYDDTSGTKLGVGKMLARADATGGLEVAKITDLKFIEDTDESQSLEKQIPESEVDAQFSSSSEATSTTSEFGDGSDGDLTVSSGSMIYVDNVRTRLSSSSSAGQRNVYVAPTSGFHAGDEVLVIQMQGTGSGRYEFGMVASIASGRLVLEENLQYTYYTSGDSSAQVLRVPNYRNVTVHGILTAHDWNGSTGGIAAFRASGNVIVGGSIRVNYRGFRGGSQENCPTYCGEGTGGPSQRQSAVNGNGAGGASEWDCGGVPHPYGGGGGGGNGTSGENGAGNEPGHGGNAAGTYDLSVMVLGGGGSGGLTVNNGHGRDGGGILFIAAKTLDVATSASIAAQGQDGDDATSDGGGGGGGAGGSVLLRAGDVSIGTDRVIALGGRGGSGSGGSGNGGGGGRGRIRVEYCDTFSGSSNPAASIAKINFCYGTLSGKAFSDDNGNGVQDTGESGLSGLAVELSDGQSTTTGSDGSYSFTANAPADYTINVTPPSGYDCITPCSVSTSIDVDSTTTVNFALRPRASVAGKVFEDENNNGNQDTGEPGKEGITVTLVGTGQTRTTASDGSYSFDDLAPDIYSISAAVPGGYVNTTPTTVSCDVAAGDTCIADFGILMYDIEKVSGSAHQNRLFLPESFRLGRRYWVQYGRSLAFSGSGEQVAQVKLPKAIYSAASMDVLLTESGDSFVQINLDVGDDGTWDWGYNSSPSVPAKLDTNDFAADLNALMEIAVPDADGLVNVPLRISFNTSGQLFLTNLVATPEANTDVSVGTGDLSFIPTDSVEGEAVEIQATLHNATSKDAAGVTAAFYATAPGWGDWYVGSDYVPLVPAGGTAEAAIEWDTLGFTGTVPVRVVVDPYGQLPETDEENNEATTNYDILTRPDLWITDVSLSDDEPVVGETVTATLVIANRGQTQASSQTTGFYDGDPDGGGALIGEGLMDPQSGGLTSTLQFTWTPTEPGPYRLFSQTDQENTVDEYDEGNNETWRDIYVGFAGPTLLDSGATPDPVYTTTVGYGVVDEGQADIMGDCGSKPHETYRLDPDGKVVYRFDHLLPGHFYHLDVTLYECGQGAGRQEYIAVDGNPVAGPEDLGDGEVHRVSILLDPALYADRAIRVTVEAYEGLGALVNEIALHDVDYRYADSGAPGDPVYGTVDTDYGWLDGSSTDSWGSLPYQTARVDLLDDDVRYRFDGLDPLKRYRVHMSFYQGSGTNRVQRVEIDGQSVGTELTIVSGERYSATLSVPLNAYVSDGSAVVSIVRTNASVGALVNEIALEEETLATEPVCEVQETPYFSYVYGSVAINDQPAPAGTVIQALNPRGATVGCFVVENEDQYGFMPIYGEDTTANPPIPGMRDGEAVLFRVNGALAMSTPLFYWHDDHAQHQVDLDAGVSADQSLLLDPGWNLFSFRLEPPVPSVAQVLSSIEGDYDRVLGEHGIYSPELPPVYNTLQELHPKLGYYLRITRTASVNALIEGASVPVTSSIPLHAGWNWVGYLPDAALPITVALDSIAGHYQRVLSLNEVYDPDLPEFSTLKEMEPGQGYLIYANDAVTLTYPEDLGASTTTSLQSTMGRCEHVSPTPYRTLVYGEAQVNGAAAPEGTRVEAVTPRGEVAGCFIVESEGLFGMMQVYGEDDTANPRIGGFREGEELSFRMNGVRAAPSVAIEWQDDWASHELSLSATVHHAHLPIVLRR